MLIPEPACPIRARTGPCRDECRRRRSASPSPSRRGPRPSPARRLGFLADAGDEFVILHPDAVEAVAVGGERVEQGREMDRHMELVARIDRGVIEGWLQHRGAHRSAGWRRVTGEPGRIVGELLVALGAAPRSGATRPRKLAKRAAACSGWLSVRAFGGCWPAFGGSPGTATPSGFRRDRALWPADLRSSVSLLPLPPALAGVAGQIET